MIRYAVKIKTEFLSNTRTRETGSLDEAILFRSEMEAFLYVRKRSAATVARVILYVKK